ncbi:GGDEF domain-containing protein [Pigmentiphaga aceris]|uniref:diguanylate cyclase n=1 Tax=Pigmentiphaga aceris TaxID=1940612 RepID=A0A5C0ATG4_9BURK|nr:GGDEF domain-containing protein [Pigmentiphaga aceris]QEI05578.1 GGDEF domain-containing protein [Pigmentiphaga aceris]
MFVDLLTLYLLAVGTLFATACMTFWEHRTNARHSRALRLLAAGFAVLGVGCALILVRRQIPCGAGATMANLVVLSGYLLILNGIAAFSGRQYRRLWVFVLVVMALVWAVAGVQGEPLVWHYLSSIPIALINGLMVWEVRRAETMKMLSARHIVVAMAGIHTIFYAARALILPWAVQVYGDGLLSITSKITLYEGVLYSVVLPMALLKLVRDETHSQLLQESQTDYLTRLGNRRSFFELGAAAVDGRGRQGPIAIFAFDLDRFKSINDVHGHQVGDDVLRRFAEIARRVLGPNAILARIGGEEFAALLAGDDARDAVSLGQSVTRQFAESARDPHAGLGLIATVSVGLAYFADEVPALPTALAAADRALYCAKAQGGDRLELA